MSLKMYPYFLNFLKKLTRRNQNQISNHMSPLFVQIHFKSIQRNWLWDISLLHQLPARSFISCAFLTIVLLAGCPLRTQQLARVARQEFSN